MDAELWLRRVYEAEESYMDRAWAVASAPRQQRYLRAARRASRTDAHGDPYGDSEKPSTTGSKTVYPGPNLNDSNISTFQKDPLGFVLTEMSSACSASTATDFLTINGMIQT